VDAVGIACLDQIRTIVEDEECSVLCARRTKRRSRGDERTIVELLVAELNHVDAAAQCSIE
jgi:hypothetical protein